MGELERYVEACDKGRPRENDIPRIERFTIGGARVL
jgi:hypothetical protein